MVFTDFPAFAPVASDVTQQGIELCRAIMRKNDPITAAFNRLSDIEKKTVIAIAGVNKADLHDAYQKGDRLQHYNSGGYIKIAEAMRKLRGLVSKFPADSALIAYTKPEQVRKRGKHEQSASH